MTTSPLSFVRDHGRWDRLHDDLWTYHVDLATAGLPLGRRMAAVRADRRFMLIGPLVPDDEALSELDGAGAVAALVVPSAFHNRFVRRSAERWATARVLLSAGARRESLPEDRLESLPATTPAPWTGTLSTIPLDGMPRVLESVFVHRPSGTLIVADLCFHLTPRYPWTTRALFRLAGAYPGVRMSRLFRGFIRDRDAFRASLDRVLDHEFDRIVVSHGETVDSGGRAAVERIRASL